MAELEQLTKLASSTLNRFRLDGKVVTVVFSIVLCFFSGVALAGDEKVIYDKDWQLKGRVGTDGRIYDETCRLKGRITPDGRGFDEDWKIKERIQPDGRIYSPDWRTKGFIRGKPGKK